MSTGKTGLRWQVIPGPIFIVLARETDFGFALSAQLTRIGLALLCALAFLRDACLCFFVLIYKIT
jgi:hypothetical protein